MKPGVKSKSTNPSSYCDKLGVLLTSLSSIILISFVLPWTIFPVGQCADLVIRIPHDVSQQDGFYRLDYEPTIGIPPANQTFRPADIRDAIEFSRGAPGTKYSFKLYYSNSSLNQIKIKYPIVICYNLGHPKAGVQYSFIDAMENLIHIFYSLFLLMYAD